MSNYSRTTGNILEIGEKGLVIIPVYIGTTDNPIVNNLINDGYLSQAAIAELRKEQDVCNAYQTEYNKDRYYLFYFLHKDYQAHLDTVFIDLITEINKLNFKRITIGLFGINEYGFDESAAIRIQEKWIREFHKENPDVFIELVIPDDACRPQGGPHMGDNPISDSDEEEKKTKEYKTHASVQMILNEIRNYRDYFNCYIQSRKQAKETIRYHYSLMNSDHYEIDTIKKLGLELNFYLCPGTDAPYPMSKWAEEYTGKDGRPYCPKPSKQMLKLIILILDMNEDEARYCLSFFGYGLAMFDREDQAFLYMLKRWPKPIDVRKANETLRKRFGKKATLF